ncbi:MAG TPA: biotin transporter BioY [Gemmatimonadales bacterium]|nr:biotin transporter BioY [Gemmatimonadales bacterium]
MSLESLPGSIAETRSAQRDRTRRLSILRRTLAVGAGALVIALSAQLVVPVPFSPVPMTLQPLAVLAVGGLLGGAAGLGALVLYLMLGISGLPVFAAGGSGILRLIGPTGGYLLAFPIAAWATGALVSPVLGLGSRLNASVVLRVLLACALAMLIIHVGGVAQLALLGLDPSVAFEVGFIPFLTGDLLKVGIAAALILAAGPKIRSLL